MQDEAKEMLKEAEAGREQLGRELAEVRTRCEAAAAERDKLKGAYGKLEGAMREYAQELKDIKESHESHVGHLQDAIRTKELREQVMAQQHKAAVGSLEAQVTSVTQRANIYQVLTPGGCACVAAAAGLWQGDGVEHEPSILTSSQTGVPGFWLLTCRGLVLFKMAVTIGIAVTCWCRRWLTAQPRRGKSWRRHLQRHSRRLRQRRCRSLTCRARSLLQRRHGTTPTGMARNCSSA